MLFLANHTSAVLNIKGTRLFVGALTVSRGVRKHIEHQVMVQSAVTECEAVTRFYHSPFCSLLSQNPCKEIKLCQHST